MWGGRGGRGACACGGGGGGGGGGVILGEVKARPKDIISFSLDYISKSKVQTSNPSSSPIPLDTPARPADFINLDQQCNLTVTSQTCISSLKSTKNWKMENAQTVDSCTRHTFLQCAGR